MVKNYEYYQMQVRHFDSLPLQLVDQLEVITDPNERIRLFPTMTAFGNKITTVKRSQLRIKTIIKRHVETLRSNVEHYYVLKIIHQSLSTWDNITDLHQDIIYQNQFNNGKIISFPKFRIVDPTTTTEELTTTQTTSTTKKEQTVSTSSAETTEVITVIVSTTTQPEIDWEKNDLDEQDSERNTGIFTPILSRIVNILMTIDSTIVYGIYQICTSSNTARNSNVASVSP